MKIGILRFFLVFICCCSISFAYSKTDLASHTQQLIVTSDSLQSGDMTSLLKIAKARNDFFRKEISNPALFMEFLLPTKIIQKLPSPLQPYLEKEITNLTGKLEIRAALYENAKGPIEAIQYVLNKDGKIYYIHFTQPPILNLKTGAMINIKHAFQIPTSTEENNLVVDPIDVMIVQDVNAIPYAFGPQKTLAILVNFLDNPTQPWTKEQISDTLFNQVSSIYYESSFKQTTVVGQTVGYFTLNLNSTDTCTNITNQVPILANQAATAAGVDLSQYPRKVYIFPRTNSCGWVGLGDVGSQNQNTKAWLNGFPTIRVTTHELGHNLGLYHSRSINCPNSPNEGTCTISEYGDGADVMGTADSAHFNALQKDRLGWLNYQNSPPITTVTTSGSYFIDVYETHNNKPKALKIKKSPTSSDFYYLEFRQGIGYDGELARCGTNCDYTKGIVFHQGSPTGGNTDLLDMTPGGDPRIVALWPCKSWKTGNVTFSVDSISTGGAKVSVTYDPVINSCTHATPTLSFQTSTPFAKEGEKVLYTILIKNNDSETCQPLNLVMTPQNISPHIITTLTKTAIKIEPGKTKSINFEVMPQKLSSGIYPIELMVKNGINDKNSVLANLTLGVSQK